MEKYKRFGMYNWNEENLNFTYNLLMFTVQYIKFD